MKLKFYEVDSEYIKYLKENGDNVCQSIEKILNKATFEIIESKSIEGLDIYIRDEDDIHVIETAINGKADILVSGDKDFEEVKMLKNQVNPTNKWEL